MCGRFVLFNLDEGFKIDHASIDPSYNIAPSQEINVIVNQDGEIVLDKYHWGLVPF